MKKIFYFIAALIVFFVWFFCLSFTLMFIIFFSLFGSEKINKLISRPERYLYFCFDKLLDKSFLP